MQEVKSDKQEVINRISPLVDKLFQGNSLYKVKLNKAEILQLLVSLFGKFSDEELQVIPEIELERRIRKIMTAEAVTGTLNDLTPEQMEMFDAAVARR